MNSIQVHAQDLLRLHSSCHGDLIAVATKYVVAAYCPKEASRQISTQYGLN